MTAMKKTGILLVLLAAAIVLTALGRLEAGAEEQGQTQLEAAVRRTAVSCYACEGFYPPSVEYMCRRYGLQYDEQAYTIRYEVFASNLMPQITVLRNTP